MMNKSKFVQAWLAYVLITFIMGFVWHLVLFKDLYAQLAIFSRIDDPIIPLGLSAMLMQGAILAYMYPRMVAHGHPAVSGVRFGLLMGAFIASSAVIAEAAKQNVTSLSTWLLLESTYYVIQFSLSGLVIGLIYGHFGNAIQGRTAAGAQSSR